MHQFQTGYRKPAGRFPLKRRTSRQTVLHERPWVRRAAILAPSTVTLGRPQVRYRPVAWVWLGSRRSWRYSGCRFSFFGLYPRIHGHTYGTHVIAQNRVATLCGHSGPVRCSTGRYVTYLRTMTPHRNPG